jgi:hypothetical protein
MKAGEINIFLNSKLIEIEKAMKHDLPFKISDSSFSDLVLKVNLSFISQLCYLNHTGTFYLIFCSLI